MIECSENYVWYVNKRRKKPKKRSFTAFFVFILIVTAFILYYRFIIVRPILNLCNEYAFSYSTSAVNKAVLSSVNATSNYENLVSISKNNLGDIELISFNSQKINKINKEIAENTNEYLTKQLSSGVDIPLLTFLGLGIFKGYGPPINFKVLSVSSVSCDFKGEFNSVGINQTRHSLYVLVNSKVSLDMPLTPKYIECETKVLISEAVLVGKVPEIYLNK